MDCNASIFLKWTHRNIVIHVVKSNRNYQNLPNFDKYLAKGNEIVDLGAKMALQNDLPQITQLRDSLESDFAVRCDQWRSILNVVLAVGELFSENQKSSTTNTHHEQYPRFLPFRLRLKSTLTHRSFPNRCYPNACGVQRTWLCCILT